MNNGNVNNNNKTNTARVRAVAPVPVASATPQVVYDIPFFTLIEAWIDCERNKRSSNSCTKFRWHAARDLVELWEQMRAGKYVQRTSMCFIVTYPVLREVWAAAFRDRIAHHWEDLRFRPVMEKYFIAVGDRSMNCRKGYGSLRAVNTFQKMIYDFTEGYTRQDCYILGGDFANFFMSIDKSLLWECLEHIIMDEYEGKDKSALLYMMSTTLFHSGTINFFRKSPISMWKDLPPRKSLFHMPGLEIGNLPNQIWANFIGAIFTDWVIHVKHVEGFIIFVDDFRCLVRSEAEGRQLIREFREYLAEQLHVTLHPDKIYLQHYSKGTKLVGAVIKPCCKNYTTLSRVRAMQKWVTRGFAGNINVEKFKKFLLGGLKNTNQYSRSAGRIYISNRTRGHFISAMMKYNQQGTTHAKRVALLEKLRATINSYLGLMCHYNSYKVRRNICEKYILPFWGKYLYFEEGFSKCVLKREYDKTYVIRKRLKNRRYAAKFIRPKWNG
ncbi:MAG: RNA-directed DNA polymerase [Lachnospiraceae bacterium]|nr:RNA-directed DNA polymerase [Lachnospiraceae bacterium]